jgi:hypothetical protein
MLLNALESSAHLCVLDAIADRRDNVIGERTKIVRMQLALESFLPRCNCRRTLTAHHFAEGRILWRCACGWSCLEAK